MTHPTTPAVVRTRRCPDCDGFPVVHITTGARNDDGTRHTLPVACPACHGTGTVTRVAPIYVLAAGGRA